MAGELALIVFGIFIPAAEFDISFQEITFALCFSQ
jgi:hypothetical protein